MNLDNVSREDWIVGGLALLLAIFLLVLPWFNVSAGVGFVTVSANYSATSTPDGWVAILAVLVCLALIVDLAIERLSPQTTLPAIGGSRATTRLALAGLIALFVFLKWVFHPIHFSGVVSFGWGFYVDIIVTAALVFFAAQVAQASPRLGTGGPAGGVGTARGGTTPAGPAGGPPSGTPGSSGPPPPPPPAG